MSAPALPARLRRIARRALACWPIGARHACCLCGRRVRFFLPYRDGRGDLPAVLTELDVIGSDLRHFECPACGCHDRERHLLLYLRATRMLDRLRGARVLHVAPESRLQHVIAAQQPAEYLRADLAPRARHVRRLDLTEMSLSSRRFDFVIANHVLEHVHDDGRALREILRVLVPGGRAILQTPYSTRLPAKFEDPRVIGDAERLAEYGQEDHRRLYGADFARYVASFGFDDRTATHADLLADVDSAAAGVNVREPLLMFEKPARA